MDTYRRVWPTHHEELVYATSPCSKDTEFQGAIDWLSGQLEHNAYTLEDTRNYWGKTRWWGRNCCTIGDWLEIRRRNWHYAWLQRSASFAGFELARRHNIAHPSRDMSTASSVG